MATTKTHRAANFAQAAVYTLIVIAILGVLNFLAQRYNKSFDSTANKKYTLSDQTAKVVKNIPGDLVITYWDRPNGFPNAEDLFDRYKVLSPKVTVEYQDVDKKRTEAIAAGVKTVPTILVKVGNKTETAKSLTEEEVTGAMVRALKGGDRTVCFTSGFGEASTTDTTARRRLRQRQGPHREEQLQDQGGPADPEAGDSDRLHHPGGGRAQAGLPPAGGGCDQRLRRERRPRADHAGSSVEIQDPRSMKIAALVAVLDSWGVKMDKDLVLDLSGVGQLFGLGPEFPDRDQVRRSRHRARDEGPADGFPDRALAGGHQGRQNDGFGVVFDHR